MAERLPLTDTDRDALVAAARAAREQAAAPYSLFRVGAALLAEDGRVFGGCNVESATFGLTVCAERTAVFKAISEGARRFRAVAVFTGADEPTPPCGACRQVLWDQCRDIEVVMEVENGRRDVTTLAVLLPRAFELEGRS